MPRFIPWTKARWPSAMALVPRRFALKGDSYNVTFNMNFNVIPLLTQVVSGIAWMLYGSFFEYYWHRFFMHKPRFPHQAFKGHTIVHHGLYKGEVDYFCREDRHPEHILLKPYAFPGIVLMHVPIMLLITTSSRTRSSAR